MISSDSLEQSSLRMESKHSFGRGHVAFLGKKSIRMNISTPHMTYIDLTSLTVGYDTPLHA